MASPGDPGYRPNQWGTASDHEKRIRALEALLMAVTGSGIQFDTDNEGGWLYVVANDSTDISYGQHGILFADTSEDGILLYAQDTGNTVNGTVSITDATVRIALSSSVSVLLDRVTGAVKVALKTGGTFDVVDNGGSPIFRVNENGSLQGKTGASLVFNL